MRSRRKIALGLSTWLLVFSGFLALSTMRDFVPVVAFVPVPLLAASVLGEWLDRRFSAYRMITTLISVLFALWLPFCLAVFGAFHAAVALLVFVQIHKLVHLRQVRDYYHVLLMAFSMVVASCSHEPGALIAVAFVLFFAGGAWTLMLLSIERELLLVRGRPAADITAPSVGRMGYEGSRFRLWRHGYVWKGTTAFVACIPILVLVFMLAPRYDVSFMPGAGAVVTTTGLSGGPNLGGGGVIRQDTSLVMEVEFPAIPDGRYRDEPYWRVATYHRFDGMEWSRVEQRIRTMDGATDVAWEPNDRGLVSRSRSGESSVVRQRILLKQVPEDGVPCLPLPFQVMCDDVVLEWAIEGDFTLIPQERPVLAEYDVWSEIVEATPSLLRGAGDSYRRVMPETIDLLTEHFLSEQVVAMAQQITAGQTNVYDKAMAIQNWLQSDEFSYDLSVLAQPSRNPVNAFVLETKRGNCQMFASAMALMLRSLGVPTRVVSGYRGAEWDEVGKSYSVMSDMAHLWVEVYFIGYGWVPFDPSPAAEMLARQSWSRASMRRLLLRSQYFWYREIVSYRGGGFRAFRGLSGGGSTVRRGEARPVETERVRDGRTGFRSGAAVFGGVALVPVLVGIPVWLWRHRKVQPPGGRFRPSPDQARARRLYRRMRRRVAKRGGAMVNPTAEELLAMASAWPEVDVGALRAIVAAYNGARFGRDMLSRQRYLELLRVVRAL